MTAYSEALDLIGGLSNPSKMPGFSTSTPASACPIGSKLAQIEGTTCNDCYALKGMYTFPVVQAALQKRLDAVELALSGMYEGGRWVEAFVTVLEHKNDHARTTDTSVFRWHDSGDLRSPRHLHLIAVVAMCTSNIRHWLPTRELKSVQQYLKMGHTIPDNLNVRISANLVDRYTSNAVTRLMEDHPQITSSLVHTKKGEPMGCATECPAYLNDNACGECRMCWDTNEIAISYVKH